MKLRKLSRALGLALADLIRENYLYHAGALTYYFILSVAPLTVALIHISGLIPFLKDIRVEDILHTLLPESASKLVDEMVRARPRDSFLALCLSYLFSVGLLRNMSRAFSYVSEGILGGRGEIFHWFAAPLLTLALLASALLFFVSLYLKAVIPGTVPFLSDLLQILPGTLYLTLLYSLFLRRRVGMLSVLTVSVFVSGSVLLMQALFTWYVLNIFERSAVYGSLSTLVAFLIWANLIFLSILLGARLIYRLERP